MGDKKDPTPDNSIVPDLWEENDYIAGTYIYRDTLGTNNLVYLVENRIDGSECVIKVLTHFDESIYRTIKSHPVDGVPKVYEVDRGSLHDGDVLIVVEEYIRGVRLTELVEQKAMDEESLIAALLEMTNILDKLHGMHPPIIHRDIKPDNVLLAEDGYICLVDFNISRQFKGNVPRDTVIMGTEGFASPEQFGFGESDARTDIYGLGATARYVAARMDSVSEELASVIERCVKLDPEDRFANVQELRSALLTIGRRTSSKVTTTTGESREKKNNNGSFLPPGFRTGTPSHIITAILGYALIIYLSVTYQIPGHRYTPEQLEQILPIYRVVTFFILIGWVLFTFNYRNAWAGFKWMKNRTPAKTIATILLGDFVILFVGAVIIATATYILL